MKQAIKSFISWVGGKSKLLWLIHLLFPKQITRFIDVFGGSGTVLMNRPFMPGCLEVYNDFNSDLVNLFFCVKNRTLALIKELGFLPLNTRDDFNVIVRFFNREEFDESYLDEELELARIHLLQPEYETLKQLMTEKAERGDVKRAADYYKLVRYSFSSNAKSFGGKNCDIRKFFFDLWECSRRLSDTVIENKDCVEVIRQYDRETAMIYCDPPYLDAERCYAVEFPKEDHKRLHDTLVNCEGYVMVSYNFCPYIVELYKEFYIYHTTRPNSMSTIPGSIYEELIITNYDPRQEMKDHAQLTLFPFGDLGDAGGEYTLIHEPDRPLKEG